MDLARYTGVVRIASFPQRFQKGCTASAATYSIRPDGQIEGRQSLQSRLAQRAQRPSRVAARASWTARQCEAQVTFFWPFWGDYWIVDLGADYEYAVVGHPGRKYLWILSRTRTMDAAVYSGILERLRAQGYDVSRLQVTLQPK